MTKDKTEIPYNQTDHYHCWQGKNPPCGQKIEHFKCCLCEVPNPKITTLLAEQKEEIKQMLSKPVKILSHKCEGWNDDDSMETDTAYIDVEAALTFVREQV